MRVKIAKGRMSGCGRQCSFYDSHGSCSGCTYQHIWKVLDESIRRLQGQADDFSNLIVGILRGISEQAYRAGSSKKRGVGGRVSIDKFLRACLEEKLQIELKESGHSEVRVGDQIIKIKHDGHFKVGERDIFIEYKGYPEKGQILASMMASKLLKEKYKDSKFYLIVHDRKQLRERMPGASRLIEAYPEYIDSVFGLDCMEEFIRIVSRG